ncbi:hypothetical protein FHS40_009074 [Streptomyces spectabilis]|uniref:Uncharacterized protein n=1 Tax=Streptomyces spectabilis TaxID=68270 RepID=A0A7W8B403_STRST|nr:hypothetical protein [Streptomyces spectabilis]
MTPPTSRPWSKRGHAPMVPVRGRSRRRFSIAALARDKPCARSRLFFRPPTAYRPLAWWPTQLHVDRLP